MLWRKKVSFNIPTTSAAAPDLVTKLPPPKIEVDLPPWSSMVVRARIAMDLLKDFDVEAEFFRKSLGYKDYFPEQHSGERWFELAHLQMSPEDIAERDANYRWYIDLETHGIWFRQFIDRHCFLMDHKRQLQEDDFLNHMDKFHEDRKIDSSMQVEYDLCVKKTLGLIEYYLGQAEDEPRIENRKAAKNFKTLQELHQKLKTVLDVDQPLVVPKHQELDDKTREAFYWENFRLLEKSKTGIAKLRAIEQEGQEHLKLLGYQIDPSGATERNKLKSFRHC
jgi:hypothetical protein